MGIMSEQIMAINIISKVIIRDFITLTKWLEFIKGIIIIDD